jgi:hypothetical protein
MTTPATNSPTCPRDRCGGPLVTYEAEQESQVPAGLLRCAGCGRYSEATPEQLAQAEAADAAWAAEQQASEERIKRELAPFLGRLNTADVREEAMRAVGEAITSERNRRGMYPGEPHFDEVFAPLKPRRRPC